MLSFLVLAIELEGGPVASLGEEEAGWALQQILAVDVRFGSEASLWAFRLMSAFPPKATTGMAGCWARAARGIVTAEPTTTLMKSRRRIVLPQGAGPRCDYSRDFRPAKWVF